MAGGNVIFYIFLVIMIVLLIRWSVRAFFMAPKPVASEVPESIGRRTISPSAAQRTAVYTIDADHRATDHESNFTDFFWNVSPQTSRQRDDLAKDDKDLPSYEEVMQMEMRQQVIGSATTTTAVTPATHLTPATTTSIIPATVTASTV